MNEPLKLWAASAAERYAAPYAVDYDHFKANGAYDLHKRPLFGGWSSVELALDRQRKTDKACDISTLYVSNALCMRRSVATTLFPRSIATRRIELLPLHLGEDEWVLVNSLQRVKQVNSQEMFISTIPWLNLAEPRAIKEAWELICVPMVTHDSAARHILLTDVVVDRIKKVGLYGLDFKHVGYVVTDASQAVPKPPDPPKPPPKPNKGKPPKLTSGLLPADEQIEIAEVSAKWRQRLQLAPDANPQTILQRITEEMQKLRPAFWTISAEERIDASLGLSAIYGELLHSACGWSWAELRASRSKRWIAVLAPTGNHALALVPYVQQQIQSEAPTVALLFNMIAAGDLPAAEPGQIRVVA